MSKSIFSTPMAALLDLETGHILWLAKGKKKQVVYDFKSGGEDI